MLSWVSPFKVDNCPKNKSHFLSIGLISRRIIRAYKHSRLARSNNKGDDKQKSSAVHRLP